jgi:hypothetical protein
MRIDPAYDQAMWKKPCIVVSGLLIVVFLGACSSSQRASETSSPTDDVVWLEAPPECEFTELVQISGRHRDASTTRSDQIEGVKHTMVEEARERGGDAVITVSITPVVEGDGSAASIFEYEGRVIQFEEPDCRQ